jgi:endonuclease YncB( thermonuclease family)
MANRKTIGLLLLLLFLMTLPCLSWAWSGKVIGIADGDTITVLRDKEQVRIRPYGIDTPERRQAFGNKAKQFTSKMVFGKVVEVDHIDTDRYGRIVALVRVDGVLVNSGLVHEGLAWVYNYYCTLPFCEEWFVLQLKARDAKRGLWADPNTIPPWEFRRKKRSQ